MTGEQITECFRKVLDTPLVRKNQDVWHGVVLVAHRLAADCVDPDDQYSRGDFLRACGL